MNTDPTVRILLLHWFPLEKYPPAMNLLDFLSRQPNNSISVCSCLSADTRIEYANPKIEFARVRTPSPSPSRLNRASTVLRFLFVALWRLICFRPHIVLYMEPHSSFPALLYRLINRKHRLFIHYHEYYSPEQYKSPGMRIPSIYHWFEKKFLYRNATWISQTNKKRSSLFLSDNPSVNPTIVSTLANYPPASWMRDSNAWLRKSSQPLKLVYVGALSLENTFLEQVLTWMKQKSPAAVTLDLYSHSISDTARAMLCSANAPNITFHPFPVPYQCLPEILQEFHVGLILYKANTLNYAYNASNKLFEYLACGLDVVYPRPMLGVKPYERSGTYPRVIEVDFDQIDSIDLESLSSRHALSAVPWTNSCEAELGKLQDAMQRSLAAF